MRVVTSILVVLCLVLPCHTFAQDSLLSKVFYGLANWTQGYSMLKVTDGGYMIAGSLDGAPMVMKIDNAGAIEWINRDSALVSGLYVSLTNGREGTFWVGGVALDPLGGGKDLILRNFISSGNVLSSKRYNFPFSVFISSIDVTMDKGLIISGTEDYSMGNTPMMFVMKSDSLGNIQWLRTMYSQGGGCFAHSARPVSGGGYILAADVSVSSSQPLWYGLLVKLDDSGAITWSKKLSDMPIGLTAAYDAVEVSGGYLALMTGNWGNLMTIKVDTNGFPSPGWKYNIFPSIGLQFELPYQRLRKCHANGYIFVSRGEGWWDTVIKTDSTGNLQWSSNLILKSTDVAESDGNGYAVLGNGPVWGWIQGYTMNPQIGMVEIDSTGTTSNCYEPGTSVPDTATASVQDMPLIVSSMTAEVSVYPSWTSASLSVDEGCVLFTGDLTLNTQKKCKLFVKPNPVVDYTYVEVCPDLSNKVETLEVYDHVGRIIYSGETDFSRPTFLDCSRFPQGVYYLKVSTEKEPLSTKMCIIR